MSRTREQQLALIQDLEGRLEEAEQTLSAIRNGTVDAFVGFGPAGETIYTLKGADEVYRLMVQQMAEGALTLTRGGVILFANEQFAAMVGMPLNDVIGGRLKDLAVDKDRDRLDTLLSASATVKMELCFRKSDHSTVPTHLAGTPLCAENGDRISLVVMDLTEQKRKEEILLQRTESLARSNRELEQFVYAASHDLQEPLRQVVSFAQLLADRYASQLDEDARDFIGFVVGSANRMLTLIHDLLLYSHVTTRGRPLAPVDCNEALRNSVLRLQSSIAECGASLTNDALPSVLGDSSQLTQLFQNLIGNAIKFRGQERSRIHVSAVREGGDWVFTVRDNGIGIDPQYFERIFVVFQRLHRTEEYPGTGIGLALCRKIVERHGGKIWVESAPGKGAAFHFTIPVIGGEFTEGQGSGETGRACGAITSSG